MSSRFGMLVFFFAKKFVNYLTPFSVVFWVICQSLMVKHMLNLFPMHCTAIVLIFEIIRLMSKAFGFCIHIKLDIK